MDQASLSPAFSAFPARNTLRARGGEEETSRQDRKAREGRRKTPGSLASGAFRSLRQSLARPGWGKPKALFLSDLGALCARSSWAGGEEERTEAGGRGWRERWGVGSASRGILRDCDASYASRCPEVSERWSSQRRAFESRRQLRSRNRRHPVLHLVIGDLLSSLLTCTLSKSARVHVRPSCPFPARLPRAGDVRHIGSVSKHEPWV